LCIATREPAVERIFALDQGFSPGSPGDEKEDNSFYWMPEVRRPEHSAGFRVSV